jgi:hypothetical protein
VTVKAAVVDGRIHGSAASAMLHIVQCCVRILRGCSRTVRMGKAM